MIALLRYGIVRSLREHLLATLLIAPLVLTSAPMLGVAVHAAFRGDPSIYPFHVPEMSPVGTARLFGTVTVVISAIVASAGAFWIFRGEIASRAVNFFFLAGHPRVVSRASTAYGFATGTLAYGLARTVITIFTASPPDRALRELAIATVSALVGSALGSMAVAISADLTILIPAGAAAVGASVTLLASSDPVRMVLALVIAAALLQAAPIVLRWRCAS